MAPADVGFQMDWSYGHLPHAALATSSACVRCPAPCAMRCRRQWRQRCWAACGSRALDFHSAAL
eukprot:6173184-Pleurochrysis_carterae.AAC.6